MSSLTMFLFLRLIPLIFTVLEPKKNKKSYFKTRMLDVLG